MSHRPVKTKCWIKFLENLGFECKRSKGSHFQYIKKGYRSIPVWASKKDIPANHIRQACRTLDINIEEVYSWIKDNC